LQLNRAIPLTQISRNISGVKLISLDSTGKQIRLNANSFLERHQKVSGQLNMYFGYIEAGNYSLSLDWNAQEEQLLFDSIEINLTKDNKPPSLAGFTPVESPAFMEDKIVSIHFSEPIDSAALTDQTFSLWKDDSSLVAIFPAWDDAFTLSLNPGNLIMGESYRIDITEFEITDIKGNRLGDSLSQFSFSIYDPDSLGKVSGEISISLPHRKDNPAILSFTKTDNNRVFLLSVSGRLFTVDLPPGKYLLSGFLDSDFDGERGKGSLIPFSYSETFAQYPDTINVRARFETSGIEMEFD